MKKVLYNLIVRRTDIFVGDHQASEILILIVKELILLFHKEQEIIDTHVDELLFSLLDDYYLDQSSDEVYRDTIFKTFKYGAINIVRDDLYYFLSQTTRIDNVFYQFDENSEYVKFFIECN